MIIGSGGREHALAFALHSSGVPLLLLPGNGGSAALPGALCAPYTTAAAAVAAVFRREAAMGAALAQLRHEVAVAAATGGPVVTRLPDAVAARVPTGSAFAAALGEVATAKAASIAYNRNKRAWG